ncbi:MAG: hypothetical protein P1P86_05485 [Bacteroidales bacterium]|nr:hypothetical protein [Bacteroidales bacterium]
MKIQKILLLLSLISLQSIQAGAQLRTWLSLESGPQWSLTKVSDPGGYFQGANVQSYMAGVTIGQEILPNLSLFTGILYVPGTDGINMSDDRPHLSSWPAYTSVLIPLRAEYIVQPTEYPVTFTPRIGYVYHLDLQADELYSAGSLLSAPDGTALSYEIQQLGEQPVSHLLEIGIGMNLRFPNAWQASLNLSYMTGLTGSPSSRYSLDYTRGDGSTSSTSYTSKGNSLLSSLALNIPLSNIWQNKDYRVRSRIENSIYDGKAVSRRGELYLGAELGSLWRSFSTTNPAIGARPMEERGIFRYANLHTGLYAGYMLSDELGIDIGAYYQRSSTFYALLYNHDVDLVSRMPAPLYLEIPLRFRYFYNVYKEKVHLVFYAGGSLLATFSEGVYSQGSAPFTYTPAGSTAPVTATSTYEASALHQVAPVLRAGTGVEYRLSMEFPLIATIYLNYMQGYRDMAQIGVTNTLTETPPRSTITYRGSGWSVDLGVKIPFRFGKTKCGQLPERETK